MTEYESLYALSRDSFQLVANQMANLSLNNGPPPPTSQMQPLPPQQQAALKQMPQQINRGYPPNNNNMPPNASQPLSPPPSSAAAHNGLAQQNQQQQFVSNGSHESYPPPQQSQQQPSVHAPPLPQQPRPNVQSEYPYPFVHRIVSPATVTNLFFECRSTWIKHCQFKWPELSTTTGIVTSATASITNTTIIFGTRPTQFATTNTFGRASTIAGATSIATTTATATNAWPTITADARSAFASVAWPTFATDAWSAYAPNARAAFTADASAAFATDARPTDAASTTTTTTSATESIPRSTHTATNVIQLASTDAWHAAYAPAIAKQLSTAANGRRRQLSTE